MRCAMAAREDCADDKGLCLVVVRVWEVSGKLCRGCVWCLGGCG
jgi:hypothetical protein